MRTHTGGLPITQSVAERLLPASGLLLCFLFFSNISKSVGCTLSLLSMASPSQGGNQTISESPLVQIDELYMAEIEDRKLQMKTMPRERGQLCEVTCGLGLKDAKGLVIQTLGKE